MIKMTEHAAARLGIAGATPRRSATAAREARPDIPRAGRGEGDRLEQLKRIASYGYSPRWDKATGFCCWHPATGARTSAHPEYAAALIAAEKELGL
jgi:hypothetical protein